MPDFDNNIDFEGVVGQNNTTQQNPAQTNDVNGEDKASLSGEPSNDITGQDNTNQTTEPQQTQESDEENNASSTGELNKGDKVEFDGITYTVDDNGNLVDDSGNVFKEAKDVQAWLNSMNQTDDSDLSLNNIQEAIGIEITDQEGNVVEFSNDAEGIKAYVNAVIDTKAEEIQQGALNKFLAQNPMIRQFVDYLVLNNGDPRGFGQLPDRQGIQLNKDDDRQLEYVIRMAANEFGNKGVTDGYIKYLRDTGGLYDEAQLQLNALIEKDKAFRQQMAEEAQRARQAELEEINSYWQNVNDVISSRSIAGYKLPESFVKQVNGQKITLTPNDFYDYLSKQIYPDANGNKISGYQRDLNSLNQSEVLENDLLNAWLMFTGGSYKDLVDMAIKEDKVRVLRLKSKEQRSAKTIKVVPRKSNKADLNDIIL